MQPRGPKKVVPTMRKNTRSKSVRQDDLSDALGLLAVYAGTECAGFLLPRGKSGVEAFDADNRSLGIFADQKSAADAIFARAS
jgi:hypothetical protein